MLRAKGLGFWVYDSSSTTLVCGYKSVRKLASTTPNFQTRPVFFTAHVSPLGGSLCRLAASFVGAARPAAVRGAQVRPPLRRLAAALHPAPPPPAVRDAEHLAVARRLAAPGVLAGLGARVRGAVGSGLGAWEALAALRRARHRLTVPLAVARAAHRRFDALVLRAPRGAGGGGEGAQATSTPVILPYHLRDSD